MSLPLDIPTARKLRAQLAAVEHALNQARQDKAELHAQLSLANEAAVRMARMSSITAELRNPE